MYFPRTLDKYSALGSESLLMVQYGQGFTV